MKKILLSVIALLLTTSIGFAQKKAPAEVQKAFTEKFPDAKSIKWEKENDKNWEAEFKLAEKEMSAEFDANGNWLQTETSVSISDLPAGVMDAIKSTFEGYTADEAEMVETADGEVKYEVELKKGKEELEVLFSFDGSVLSRELEEDD